MDRLRRLMALSGLVLLGLGGQVAGMGAGDYASLDELLSDFVDPDEPGVVVLVNVGGTRESAARGMADLAEGRSIRVGDQFRIGSATKPFVAALVLQLVEEGRMSLDEPIATYLPPDMVPRIANVRRASVAQVLAMTSGVPDYTASDEFDERVRQRPSYPWQAAEVVAFVFDEPASFDPGTDYEYSNTNYILAQLAIERVLNTTLQQAMAERMFEPLGLTGSFVEMPGRFAEGIVTGYEDHRGWEDVTRINDGVGLGDGGVVSSAAELERLALALWDGTLLRPASRDRMMSPVRDNYGLGIGVDRSMLGTIYSHAGATSGFQSVFALVPSRDAVVVVLTNNFDSQIVEDLVYAVLEYAL